MKDLPVSTEESRQRREAKHERARRLGRGGEGGDMYKVRAVFGQ